MSSSSSFLFCFVANLHVLSLSSSSSISLNKQSQPCHWRNIKSVVKRDVSNVNKTIANETDEIAKKEKNVSDNISLFQSLRVLQEGEGDEFNSAVQSMCTSNMFVFFLCNFSRSLLLFSRWH